MSRKLAISIIVVAFVALSLTLLAGCPKPADNGPVGGAASAPAVPTAPAVPAVPGMPSLPKVSKSGDTVTYNGKDEKGQAVSVTSQKQGMGSEKMTVKTDKGTMTAKVGKDQVSEKDLGVAFYPGATVQTGINAAQTGAKAGKVQLVTLTSTDSYAKIAAFYKGTYGNGNSVMERGGSLMISIKSGANAGKMIMIGPAADKKSTQIIIHSTGGM